MLDRRDVLKISGIVATTGTIGASSFGTTSASDAIFSIEPDQYESGEIPDGVIIAGRNDQEITGEVAGVDSNAYAMYGEQGGCSETLARAEAPIEDAVTVSGYMRVGDGETGCFDTVGGIALQTIISDEADDGPRLPMLQLFDDGDIEAFGVAVDTYSADEWIEFNIGYERITETAAVKQTVRIDGSAVTVSQPTEGYEPELTGIELQATDHTIYWDDVRVYDGIDPESATFLITSIDEQNEDTAPADDIQLQVSVENAGEVRGIEPVTVEFDGERVDRSTIELDSDEQEERSYSFEAPSEPGSYEVVVQTADERQSLSIDVSDGDGSEVVITGFDPTTVTADPGDDVVFTVDIINDGAATDSALVDLLIDGTIIEDAVFPIGSGEEESLEFTVTAPEDADEYLVEAVTDGDTAESTLTVEGAAEGVIFEITDLTVNPSRPDPGEDVTIVFEVTNNGPESETQPIEVVFDGDEFGEFDITLSDGETATEEFVFDAPTEAGTYDFTVSTNDDTASETITVETDREEPEFEIIELFPREQTVESTEDVVVAAAIRNVGSDRGETDVELLVEGTRISTSTISLQPDGEDVIEFEIDTLSDAGTYEYTVAIADDDASGSIEIVGIDDEFEITEVLVPDRITGADTFEIEAVVSNPSTEEQTEVLTIDAVWDGTDELLYEDQLELPGGAQATVTNEFTAPSVEAETTVELILSTEEATAETAVTVEPNVTEPTVQADDGTPEDTEITVPGFTIPGTVASIGGTAYLLRNRFQNTNREES